MNRVTLSSLVTLTLIAMLYFKVFDDRVSEQSQSTAVQFSEDMSDGRVDVSIRKIGEMTVMIEVKLAATQDTIDLLQLKPVANLAMEKMHMDGISPMFSLVGSGDWQGKVILPMAGPWVVSVGIGEEFIETTFDVR